MGAEIIVPDIIGPDTSGDLPGFVSIILKAWDLLMTDFYIYGYAFSYGKILLLMMLGLIAIFIIREFFLD